MKRLLILLVLFGGFCCAGVKGPDSPILSVAEHQYNSTARVHLRCGPFYGEFVGSAVAVGPNLLMSAQHVSGACEAMGLGEHTEITIQMFGSDEKIKVKRRLESVGRDLAFLESEERLPHWTETEKVGELPLGAHLCSVGGDRMVKYIRKCGQTYEPDDGELIYTTARAVRGNSGGPLFRGRKLVGVVIRARYDPGVEHLTVAVHFKMWTYALAMLQ